MDTFYMAYETQMGAKVHQHNPHINLETRLAYKMCVRWISGWHNIILNHRISVSRINYEHMPFFIWTRKNMSKIQMVWFVL